MRWQLEGFLLSWSWQPTVLIPLLVFSALYAIGWKRLRGRGRGRAAPARWRVCCYYGGMAAIWLALLSPIDTFSDLLFFLHMSGHLLLLEVAPLLIWLGMPFAPLFWSLPHGLRREVAGLFTSRSLVRSIFSRLTHPVVATTLYVVVVAIWHLPVLYDAAEGQTLIHYLEHTLFLGAGLIWWWTIVHPGRRRIEYAPLYVLIAASEGGVIGGGLTFLQQPVYVVYEQVPRLWGISALADQQIGGIVMWLGGGVIYIVYAIAIFIKVAWDEERAMAAHERI